MFVEQRDITARLPKDMEASPNVLLEGVIPEEGIHAQSSAIIKSRLQRFLAQSHAWAGSSIPWRILAYKDISNSILANIKDEITLYNSKPTLAVINVGNNNASQLYIQKKVDIVINN